MSPPPFYATLRIGVYAIAAVVLGAALTPFVYNFGMGIAEVSDGKETNGAIRWFAEAVWRSRDQYPKFLWCSVVLGALVLLPLATRRASLAEGLIRVRRTGWREIGLALLAFVIAMVLWAGSGLALSRMGVVRWQGPVPPWPKVLVPASLPIFGQAMLEEWAFRGALLGAFLRLGPRWLAALVSSLVFALLHFFLSFPMATVADPEALGAGFSVLGQISRHLAQPMALAQVFAPWLVLGLVLSWLRLRAESLLPGFALYLAWLAGGTVWGRFAASGPRAALFPEWPVLPGIPIVALLGTLVLWLSAKHRKVPQDE